MKIRVYIEYTDQYNAYKTHNHYCILDTDSAHGQQVLNAIYNGKEDEALDMINWQERDMHITRIAVD